eukprot:Plantae.Rhodophyta-Hildenbrandia_rubra.ctg8300.p1 GENE.Plantae.Rhodophyta-Hildenbrandia_rubra.ctg8300~~Plantae.Rhodophyta-Hildenbrandia_rubra.ctg8300.p1  ORF type:complete len:1032 (+),score=155.42 Plantae.Rhodophyta-Hildenbrandia_rubra.ctg8300:169-3096(+)
MAPSHGLVTPVLPQPVRPSVLTPHPPIQRQQLSDGKIMRVPLTTVRQNPAPASSYKESGAGRLAPVEMRPVPGLPLPSLKQTTQNGSSAPAPQISSMPRPPALEPPCGAPRYRYRRGLSVPKLNHSGAPFANSDFIAVDDGSASIRFMRLTTGAIPTEPSLYSKGAIPLAVLLTPFAEPAEGESYIPTVDCAEKAVEGPLRCPRCNAYANPGFKFSAGGSELECNLCGHVSPTPAEHYAALSPSTGLRMDIETRPEFSHGSVEYLVKSSDYCLKPPKAALYVYIVDVTDPAIRSGLSYSAAVSIRNALRAKLLSGTNKNGGARVGIITYNDKLHFYDARGEGVKLQCVPDVDDPFVPIGGHAFGLSADEAANALDYAIDIHMLNPSSPRNVDRRRSDTFQQGSCLGAALHSLKSILGDCGGKVFVVAGGLPVLGLGKIERRGARGANEDREMELLKPITPEWDILGLELAEIQCSVDIIMANLTPYVDACTIMRVCRATGGKTWLFDNWNVVRDSAALHRAICTASSSARAFEALLRVRMSLGMEPVGEFLGHFGRPQQGDDVSGPVFDQETCLALEVAVTSKVEQTSSSSLSRTDGKGFGFSDDNTLTGIGRAANNFRDEACIQSAVLYTDPVGIRKIRVHTLFARRSSALSAIFLHGDVDATAAFMAKKAATAVLADQVRLREVRNSLVQTCAQSLFVYRKYCISSASPGQLVLSESMKVLPVMCLGLIKSTAFRDTGPSTESVQHVAIDERSAALYYLSWATPAAIAAFAYPRMYDLSTLCDAAGTPLKEGTDESVTKWYSKMTSKSLRKDTIALPNSIGLSSESLRETSILLIENGMKMVLWIGTQTSRSLVESITLRTPCEGMLAIRAETGGSADFVKGLDDKGTRIAKIIRRIIENRAGMVEVSVVSRTQPGQSLEARRVLPLLVEDRHSNGGWSYIEFLKHLHRRVMDQFEKESSQRDMQNWEMFNHF